MSDLGRSQDKPARPCKLGRLVRPRRANADRKQLEPRLLTYTARWGTQIVGAPSTADINQRVQVPSVETGMKRGEPWAVTR